MIYCINTDYNPWLLAFVGATKEQAIESFNTLYNYEFDLFMQNKRVKPIISMGAMYLGSKQQLFEEIESIYFGTSNNLKADIENCCSLQPAYTEKFLEKSENSY